MVSPAPDELAAVPLFSGLDAAEQELLATWLDVSEAEAGHRFTHQGAAGYTFFLLREGAAAVIVDDVQVATLGAGDFFGEVSMLEEGRQTATVQTTEPSIVWAMFGTRFRELEAQHPQLAEQLRRTAEQRHPTR